MRERDQDFQSIREAAESMLDIIRSLAAAGEFNGTRAEK